MTTYIPTSRADTAGHRETAATSDSRPDWCLATEVTGETPSQYPRLGPGSHPPPDRPFEYDYAGNPVSADPAHVGDPFAAGLRTWQDPAVSYALRAARDNLRITPQVMALLPWALTTVTAASPSGFGLFAAAGYAGPGATGLLGLLGHRTRSQAFAAELVVAACLTYRSWISHPEGLPTLDLDGRDCRLDFGVKLLGASPGRRTAEADILLTGADGSRVGVDVKHSVLGTYRSAPSLSMLAVVRLALQRGEIASFHFVTPGRFRPAFRAALVGQPGVYAHEHVWPTDQDRQLIAGHETQAIDYSAAAGRIIEGTPAAKVIGDLIDDAADRYRDAFGRDRKLVTVEPGDGFTYLFDATVDAPADKPPPRVIAGWGETRQPTGKRDRRFLAGFPLPPSHALIDRGHLIARSAGGGDSFGLNLIPQERDLNRGHSAQGRRWRALERLAATSPRTPVLVRAVYGPPSDTPSKLEYLLVATDGPVFSRFTNLPGSP